MSQPTKPAFLDLKIDTCAPSLVVQIVVGNFVGPEDVADPSQTTNVECRKMILIFFIFCHSFTGLLVAKRLVRWTLHGVFRF